MRQMAIVVGIVVAITFLGQWFSYRTAAPSASSRASGKLSMEEDAFHALNAAQHLAIAKRDYKKSFFLARKHLAAIPKDAPEYAEVPILRRQIDAAEEKQEQQELLRNKAVTPARATPIQSPRSALTLDPDWKFAVGPYDTLMIVGVVRNPTLRQYRYAQISFNLYDKQGNQVGTAFTNVRDLEPGGRWKFQAHVLEPWRVGEGGEARFKDLSGVEE